MPTANPQRTYILAAIHAWPAQRTRMTPPALHPTLKFGQQFTLGDTVTMDRAAYLRWLQISREPLLDPGPRGAGAATPLCARPPRCVCHGVWQDTGQDPEVN